MNQLSVYTDLKYQLLLNQIFWGLVLIENSFIPYIKYLKAKCLKAWNLLKVLSHTSWSADRMILLTFIEGMLGCGGVMYLTSAGRPADIGLQLGKACFPSSGNGFISSVSSLSFLFLFWPPLSSPLLSLLSLSSLCLRDDTKWPSRVDVLNPSTTSQSPLSLFNSIKTWLWVHRIWIY